MHSFRAIVALLALFIGVLAAMLLFMVTPGAMGEANRTTLIAIALVGMGGGLALLPRSVMEDPVVAANDRRPDYSHFGTLLYDSIVNRPQDWRDHTNVVRGLLHRSTGMFVWHASGTQHLCVTIGRTPIPDYYHDSVERGLTYKDHVRLCALVKGIHDNNDRAEKDALVQDAVTLLEKHHAVS